MKETILHTPKNISFAKRIVKHLPQAIRRRLPAEISVVPVSRKESLALNRRYRNKRTPANVLSFLYAKSFLSSPDQVGGKLSGLTRGSRSKKLDSRLHGNDKRDKQKRGIYGEIIICPAIIRAEAKAQGHSFEYQFAWMVVHGMIHLSGLHHEKSRETEKRVGAVEKKILQKLFQKSGTQHHRIA